MPASEVPQRRLGNSGLAGLSFRTVSETVRAHGAVQAQDHGPVKWSIGRRTQNVGDEDVEQALSVGELIRTHVLRPTWHIAAKDDIRWLLSLTGPRVQKQNAPRYKRLGLDAPVFARSGRIISTALSGGRHLTRSELAGALERDGVVTEGQRLPHILMYWELEGLICSGKPSGKKQTYALMDERVPGVPALDREEAVTELIRRYLRSRGPATVHDIAWWSSLTIKDLDHGLASLGSEVVQEEMDRMTFWALTESESNGDDARGALLLHTYDEMIVGYSRSRFFGDPRGDRVRANYSDRTLPGGLLLISGLIAGHWRRVSAGRRIDLDIRLYEEATARTERKIRTEAETLERFVGLPVRVALTPI